MKNLKFRPIGIMDSGVGGLGIFSEIKNRLPSEDLLYFADTKNMPYGARSDEEVRQLSGRVVKYLIDNYNIKMCVVACNTATISSISYLRERFDIPFVGVVPVVKPASKSSITNKIAIMGTPLTVNSEYQKKLISDFADGVDVVNIPCPGLVELIEDGDVNTEKMKNTLKILLSSTINNGIDVLGLGCTHYTFLKNDLKEIIPANIKVLDSNEPVAKQTVRVLLSLPEGEIADSSNQPAFYKIMYSGKSERFVSVVKKLLGYEIDEFEKVEI